MVNEVVFVPSIPVAKADRVKYLSNLCLTFQRDHLLLVSIHQMEEGGRRTLKLSPVINLNLSATARHAKF